MKSALRAKNEKTARLAFRIRAAEQIHQQHRRQRPVHDEIRSTFGLARIVAIIVDAMCIVGQCRKPHQRGFVRHKATVPIALWRGGAAGRRLYLSGGLATEDMLFLTQMPPVALRDLVQMVHESQPTTTAIFPECP